MFSKKSICLAAMVAGLGMASSGAALAAPVPFEGFGEINVNNTGKTGGAVPSFVCAVKVIGRIDRAAGTASITGALPINNGRGMVPAGCTFVATSLINWNAAFSGSSITINGLAFQAPGQPGCGYDGSGNPDPTSSVTAGFSDTSNVVITFNNSVVNDSDPSGNCVITDGWMVMY